MRRHHKERGKSAYIRRDTCENDLFLPSGLDGSLEVGIVPCIDLAVPLDEGRAGVHLKDLLRERSIGSLI